MHVLKRLLIEQTEGSGVGDQGSGVSEEESEDRLKAAESSIAPGAKQQLGEVGWVAKGRAQPALDEVIFELGPGELGGPVESTEGWHLVTVLDVADAKFDNFEDAATRKLTRRRYIHDQLDSYVMDLRKNAFTVEVYEDNMVRLAQKEADMVARLTEQAAKPGSTVGIVCVEETDYPES